MSNDLAKCTGRDDVIDVRIFRTLVIMVTAR